MNIKISYKNNKEQKNDIVFLKTVDFLIKVAYNIIDL